MFYSEDILTRRGPLAVVWLAAVWIRKISKVQVNEANISRLIRDLECGSMPPMALRLKGQLLLGFSNIYSKKTVYLLDECSMHLAKLKPFQEKGITQKILKNPVPITIDQTQNATFSQLLGNPISQSPPMPSILGSLEPRKVLAEFDENEWPEWEIKYEDVARRSDVGDIEAPRRDESRDSLAEGEVSPMKIADSPVQIQNDHNDSLVPDENFLIDYPLDENIQIPKKRKIGPVPVLFDKLTEIPGTQIQHQITDTKGIINSSLELALSLKAFDIDDIRSILGIDKSIEVDYHRISNEAVFVPERPIDYYENDLPVCSRENVSEDIFWMGENDVMVTETDTTKNQDTFHDVSFTDGCLEDYIPGNSTKRYASRVFYSLLVSLTEGKISCQQDVPYGTIRIKKIKV